MERKRSAEFQNNRVEFFQKEKAIDFTKDFLAQIDSSLLKLLCERVLSRSNIEFNAAEYLEPRNAEVVWMENDLAGNFYEGKITINSRNAFFEKDKGKSRSSILKTFIHKLIHSLSHKDTGGISGYQVRIGLEKSNHEINEAMTELIQDQIFREYLKQSGDRMLLASENGAVLKRLSYPEHRQKLVHLIDLTAKHFAVPKEIIFQGLMSGYFTNKNEEIKSFFEEILPEGETLDEYMDILRDTESTEELAKTMNINL